VLALLLLAAALGLDNFAAAIGIGVSGASGGARVRMAVVFGLFEAGMPVLGLLLGRGLASGIGVAARWLGGAALIAVGVVGLIQALRGGAARSAGPAGPVASAGPVGSGGQRARGWSMGRMLGSGLVLSADNLAAGFALGAYHAGLAAAAIVFGVVSVGMALAGLELGARIGAAAGERSELVACLILVVVGAVIASGVLLSFVALRLRSGSVARERMTRAVRPNGMMTRGQVPGPVVAAVLCAALAGCGSVAASSTGAAAPAGTSTGRQAATSTGTQAATSTGTQAATSSASASGQAAAPASGCAAVNQATTVTIHRTMHLVEPVRVGALSVTQRKAALVQALFRDFCNAVGHPAKPTGLVHCPVSIGMDYTGTFYDGSRSLATFVYGATGCQTVSVTAGGKQRSTILYGTAAAAAPHLQADMAAVLGVPKYAVSAPQSSVNPGGPGK
jgi:manganese efflux pump family protein